MALDPSSYSFHDRDDIYDPDVDTAFTGQIKGTGLNERPTAQGRITSSVNMGGVEHLRKIGVHDPAEVYAPGVGIGEPNSRVEKINRGDLLFMFPDEFRYRHKRVGPVTLPEVNVTAATNGIDRNRRAAFFGIALFSGLGEGFDRTTDNVGTAHIFGVAATENNSPETFFPGDDVGVTPHSWLLPRKDGHGFQGAIDQIGQDPNKFRGRLFRISSRNILSQFEGIEIKINKRLRDAVERGITHQRIDKVCKDICDEIHLPFDQPMACAVFLVAARRICHSIMRNEGGVVDAQTVLDECQSFIAHAINTHWVDWCQEARQKYDGMINVSTGNLMGQYSKFQWPDGLAAKSPEFWQCLSRAMSMIDTALKSVQAFQQDFIKASRVGIALQLSRPGEPIDLGVRLG